MSVVVLLQVVVEGAEAGSEDPDLLMHDELRAQFPMSFGGSAGRAQHGEPNNMACVMSWLT